MLRWRIPGLIELDRLDDAFTGLLEVADHELAAATTGTQQMTPQQVERERSVRVDRWVQGHLRQIVGKADAPMKARIASELKERLQRASSIGGVHVLRMFLNLFGFHELADA